MVSMRMRAAKPRSGAAHKTEAGHLSPALECEIAAPSMPLAAPPPALPAIELALGPALAALCALGAVLAFQAWRAGFSTARRALLGACFPATLWLLLVALNPTRPTHVTLTPLGAGLAASFGCGLFAAQRAARRGCCSAERSVDCYLWSCAAALPSAWLFHWLGKLGGDASVVVPSDGELSASGALLGAVACSWWCFWQQPLRRQAWLDVFAPALGLALMLSWSGAYLQDPTHSAALLLAAAGLALTSLTLTMSAWQRYHGQSFALAALGYGIVQLSTARLDVARGITSWWPTVAGWLVIALALVAGWVWRKAFTSSGI